MVRLERVGKRYAAGPPVLADLSLSLAEGGFYFLTGASGSGKTTLVNIMSLAERPTSGRLVLFDTDTTPLGRPARAALRRRIGVVFQDYRLLDRLNAHDNIALPLRIANLAEARVHDNVMELLDWVGLKERGDTPVALMSSSERQRVAIARAIVARPDLLLADEPSGQVDHEIARLLVRIFERINQLGTTVLIATHDIAFASRFDYPRFHLEHGALAAGDIVPPQ